MSAESLLLRSTRVVCGGGDEPLRVEPACLEIHAWRIRALHPATHDDGWPGPATAERVDYGDKLIAPAWINGHTHLALGFLRGADLREVCRGNMVENFFFAIEARMTPADVRAFTRMGAYESLLSGCGLVWDHYYAAEQVAAGLADVGLAGVVAPTLQDLSGPGVDTWEAQLQATAAIDDSSDYAARGIAAALGPHATDTVSATLFEQALNLAEARDLPLHFHLAQSIEEYERCQARHGCSPVTWLARLGMFERAPATMLAHVIYASRADLKQLRGGRQRLVYCPYSQLVFGFPAAVDVWHELGLPWLVATDCASNNDSMNVQKELRILAGQRTVGASWSPAYRRFLDTDEASAARDAWLQRSEMFDRGANMATHDSMLARVWSLPGEVHPRLLAGKLAPGYLANLAIWDLEHPAMWPAGNGLAALAMSDPGPALWAMWVAGRRIGNDGELQRSVLNSDDYREARQEAEQRWQALRDRIG